MIRFVKSHYLLRRMLPKSVFVGLVIVVLSGCTSPAAQKSNKGEAAGAEGADPRKYTNDFDATGLTVDAVTGSAMELWALVPCECAPSRFKKLLESSATDRGVLPQILIPTVREEIKNNTALATLQKIPFGGLLADFFTSDEKLADKVRDGLSEKLKKTPGGSTLGERVQFRFDGFFPESGGKDTFSVESQISRWAAVFAADGIWSGKEKIDGVDHGLQTLALLKALSEWKYMIGLDPNSSGGFYGGLGLRMDQGLAKMAGPLDPRKPDGADFFLSGSYTLSYDEKGARELATSVKEVWKHGGDAVSLDEQSRLWYTAALAFKKLRPENRKNLSSLFDGGKDAILPPEVHTLPLAFLGTLKYLLPTLFIDRDARLVREIAGEANTNPASVVTLSRLIQALTTWTTELSSASSAGLDKATLEKLSKAPEELRPAIQLAVQTILKDHVASAGSVGGYFGVALTQDGEQVGISAASEVLLALMNTEKNILPSPFLNERISQILDWYAGDLLQSKSNLSVEELYWARAVAASASEYLEDGVAHWASSVLSFANSKLAGVEP